VNVPVVQALQSVIASTEKVGQSKDDRINMMAAANAAWDSARAPTP
jgi:filamentous hemagglutinin